MAGESCREAGMIIQRDMAAYARSAWPSKEVASFLHRMSFAASRLHVSR